MIRFDSETDFIKQYVSHYYGISLAHIDEEMKNAEKNNALVFRHWAAKLGDEYYPFVIHTHVNKYQFSGSYNVRDKTEPIEQKEQGPEPCEPVTPTEYVLIKSVDWFGRTIPAGTIYKQAGPLRFCPTIDGINCPHLEIVFRTILNNPDYFLQLLK